jgi:hypothetical protein
MFSIFAMSIAIIFPIFALTFVMSTRNKTLDSKKYHQRVGSLYENIRTNSKIPLMYLFIFLLRRVVFSLTALYLDTTPIIQISLMVVCSVMIMEYLEYVKPFTTKL